MHGQNFETLINRKFFLDIYSCFGNIPPMTRMFSQISGNALKIHITHEDSSEQEVSITDPESFYAAKPVLQPVFEMDQQYVINQISSSINWADSETDNKFVIKLVEWLYHGGEKPKKLKRYENNQTETQQ